MRCVFYKIEGTWRQTLRIPGHTHPFVNLYLAAAQANGQRPAIEWADRSVTYGELLETSLRIAAFLRSEANEEPAVGVFATRSLMSYAGALGIMLAGKAYVPLNTDFPEERLHRIVARSGIATVLMGGETILQLSKMNSCSPLKRFLFLDEHESSDFVSATAFPIFHSRFFTPLSSSAIRSDPDSNAYILFTSGSTGEPKGIAIKHCNLNAYLEWALATFPLAPEDRCSQTFEMSFDLSIHDLLVTFCQGATLIVPAAGDLLFPAHYLKKRGITSWFSVPAMAMQMKQMGQLKSGAFPTLKYSLFCGEALPRTTADAWELAAPHSRCFNLYGPTEATIAATFHEWTGAQQGAASVVPIGKAFPAMKAEVFDPRSETPLQSGEGELWLAGPQLAEGYLNAPELTRKAFVTHAGERWYRTGDLAAKDARGDLHFIGRIDHQVKRYGYRIELGEIEATLRRHSAVEVWVVLLIKEGPDENLVAVAETTQAPAFMPLLEACRTALPSYMVPTEIRAMAKIPLNSNGKIDRKALAQLLTTSKEPKA